MKNKEKIRERFMRDPPPRRLGGLAATFGRISSSARKSIDPTIVIGLLDEAKHLIEWTAADTEPETASELVRIQTMIVSARILNGASCYLCRQRIGVIRLWIFPAWHNDIIFQPR